MGANIFRQEEGVRSSDAFDSSIAASEANFETNPVHLENDLNVLRSLGHSLLKNQAGNWYDGLNVPATLETGTARGVNDLNTDLHAIEKQRRLRRRSVLVDVTVTAAQNWEVLGSGEIPAQTTAAVGAVTTKGTVVAAHGGTFGTHALDEVVGLNALAPKNLCEITDGSGDPILSGGRRVWALLQSENATDGHTINLTDSEVQLSFVRPNAGFTDLEAVPVGDIAGSTIRYAYTERVAHDELNEQDFLSAAAVDIGAGAGTIDRQTAYNNQGATPVDVTTNSILDLEGPGLSWGVRDDLEAYLFRIIEGSAGGTSQVQVNADVDTFDVDAVANDFLNGISVDTGAAGTTLRFGVVANQIDSGGVLSIQSGGGADLSLAAALELNLTDSYRAGSTWSLADGIALASSSQEWSDFETQFGEVSLLNAIEQASKAGGLVKVWATCTVAAAKDADVSGPSNDNNLDTDLGDLSAGSFLQDYEIYYNGRYQRPGADASANHDVYPGTALANGQLKFEHKVKVGDEIAVFKRV